MNIDLNKIELLLRDSKLIQRIFYYEFIDSTNDVAKDLMGHGLLVIAEKQKRGKGRRGRLWISPYGGLWFSLVMKLNRNRYPIPLYNLMVGVAVARVIKKLGLDVCLKWPNDVIINNKKVCGILSEVIKDRIVIGIGINVNVDIQEFPIDLRSSVTSLMNELGNEVDREELLVNIIKEIENMYLKFDKNEILKSWKALDMTLNKYVRVLLNNKVIEGLAIDIDNDGALLIITSNNELMKFYSCDVSIR
ncbi:MAG: biotin--[acetyl-CoA-carboxylase] ligase [Nitrososphaerales archaeon]